MKTIFHSSTERGGQDHGWLKAQHSFSFGNFYDPSKMNFGTLRVLNDDWVAPAMGFSTHPHDNMEIITIPLSGQLHHGDSMGNSGIIEKGEIQIMSAGTGVRHSEKNASNKEPVSLLQIWVIPNKSRVEPRYDQRKISEGSKINDFQQIISPNSDDEGSWIYQDAWFNLLNTDNEKTLKYNLNKAGNGVYIFVILGGAKIGEQRLSKRDALGIWEADSFEISAEAGSQILLMEVPMSF